MKFGERPHFHLKLSAKRINAALEIGKKRYLIIKNLMLCSYILNLKLIKWIQRNIEKIT